MSETTKPVGRSSFAKGLFAVAVIVLLGSSLAQRYLGHVMSSPDGDFYDYYLAGRVVSHDAKADLYEGTTDGNPQLKTAPVYTAIARESTRLSLGETELYLYPPLLADLLIPISHLSPHVAALLWRAFNLLLVVLSALGLARLTRIPRWSMEFVVLVVLAFAFWPIHETVSLGQVSIVLLTLYTICLLAYGDGYVALSAAALALATIFKITPVLIVPIFFVWKDRRWIAWYAGCIAASIVAMGVFNGWGNLNAYLHLMGAMSGVVPALQNKNVGSLLAWVYYGRVFDLGAVQQVLHAPVAGLALVSKAVSSLLYCACLAVIWRRQRNAVAFKRPAIIGVFALAIATLSPVSWRHGYTVALIPLVFLWVGSLTGAVTRRRLLLLFLSTISVGSLVFDLAAQAPIPMFLKIVCASTWTVCVLLLCADALWDGVGLVEE